MKRKMTNPADSWIEGMIEKSQPLDNISSIEKHLAELLIDTCYKNKNLADGDVGRLLASGFDLLVAAQYYSGILHNGWMYCPSDAPRLFYPFTNCCPRHVLENEFYFHNSNKPQSGKIGTATSRILLLFHFTLFKTLGREVELFKGIEPVDAIVVSRSEKKVLFAEIKASPLTIPAISVQSQQLMDELEGEIVKSGHSPLTNINLFNAKLEILIPKRFRRSWKEAYYDMGIRKDVEDREWGYRGLINLLQNESSFFVDYYSFWREAFETYHPKKPESIFWLTNGCGTPYPIPPGWSKRIRGHGYQSVSDSKTSVGMDRTDDIKKGIYQVLKLGTSGKRAKDSWDFKVGILSNIHAARHFDEYLQSLKDIVWTLDYKGGAKKVSDLPKNQALYNLFDGIITFTHSVIRDEWIESLFNLRG